MNRGLDRGQLSGGLGARGTNVSRLFHNGSLGVWAIRRGWTESTVPGRTERFRIGATACGEGAGVAADGGNDEAGTAPPAIARRERESDGAGAGVAAGAVGGSDWAGFAGGGSARRGSDDEGAEGGRSGSDWPAGLGSGVDQLSPENEAGADADEGRPFPGPPPALSRAFPFPPPAPFPTPSFPTPSLPTPSLPIASADWWTRFSRRSSSRSCAISSRTFWSSARCSFSTPSVRFLYTASL